MSARSICAALACACAGLAATSAWAWDDQEAPRWADGTVTLHLRLGDTPTYSDGMSPNGAARAAMQPWNEAMARVKLAGVTGSGAPIGEENGFNTVSFGYSVHGQPLGEDVLGVTLIYGDDTRDETDVVLNQAEAWDSYRGQLRQVMDIQRVLMHEFGHVLGLDHPDEDGQSVGALMNAYASDLDRPVDDDLNGIVALYGLDPAAVTPSAPFVGWVRPRDTAEEGEEVVFTSSISGSAPMLFQWYRDGVAVPGANRMDLRLNPAKVADTGSYTLVATNNAGSVTSSSYRLTVTAAVAPSFDAPTSPVVREVGGEFYLSVYHQGSRPITAVWRRDGAVVAEYTDYGGLSLSYSRSNLAPGDAGNYTLTLTNRVGSATSAPISVVVRPKQAPLITMQPASCSAEAGGFTALSCSATGGAPLRYQWKKDGVVLPEATNSSLGFQSLTTADVGSYTVVVSNEQGSVESRSARVTIAPSQTLRFTAQPSGGWLQGSGTIWMSVTAWGREPLTYQWFKDGVPMPNETSTSYMRWVETEAETGVFTVSVTDASGTVMSDPAEWRFVSGRSGLPRIIVSPSAIAAAPGETAELETFVYDGNSVSYRWRKDGVDLPNETTSRLRFENLQPHHAGNYSVVVSNRAGSVTSKTARVTVTTGAAPLIRRQPANLEVEYGSYATLQVEVTPGAYSSIRWQRDGVFVGEQSQYLSIQGATTADNGTYRAVVVTTAGETVLSDPAVLTVRPLQSPLMLNRLPNWSVPLGETVTFGTWQGDRPLPAELQWYKNGVAIPGATRYELRLDAVQAADAGSYTAVLTNAAGTFTSNAGKLTIAEGVIPVILEHPGSAVVEKNSLIVLTVQAAQGYSLRYQWFHDGTPMPEANDRGLMLSNITEADAGRYTVTVTNSAGSVTSDPAEIFIGGLPAAPAFVVQPVSQRVTAGSTLGLRSYATGVPEVSYQWRKDGQDISGATSPALGLANVTAANAGTYSVVASNSAGRAESQVAVVAVDPTGRLLNLSARAKSGAGENVLIAGFVVTGTQPKRLLVRGIGPGLASMGISQPLEDPSVTIFNGQGQSMAAVDDWNDGSFNELMTSSNRLGAFPLEFDSGDAALVVTLHPGVYTAHVKIPAGAPSGIGLVELYDSDASAPRLVNISARTRVEPGEGALIAGFVVGAGAPKRVLVRAIGPSLAAQGIAGVLANPKVDIVPAGRAAMASNDDWGSGDVAALKAAFAQVGAFELNSSSKDAAVIVTLAPGVYTALVTGTDGGSGVALVEVYELVD